MALLEAMSYGLAVVTTPVGGIPEVVKDGINGVLIPPGDVAALAGALQRLFGDATERQRLGAAARATIIDNFAIEATLERLLAIYQRFGVEARTPRRS